MKLYIWQISLSLGSYALSLCLSFSLSLSGVQSAFTLFPVSDRTVSLPRFYQPAQVILLLPTQTAVFGNFKDGFVEGFGDSN